MTTTISFNNNYVLVRCSCLLSPHSLHQSDHLSNPFSLFSLFIIPGKEKLVNWFIISPPRSLDWWSSYDDDCVVSVMTPSDRLKVHKIRRWHLIIVTHCLCLLLPRLRLLLLRCVVWRNDSMEYFWHWALAVTSHWYFSSSSSHIHPSTERRFGLMDTT